MRRLVVICAAALTIAGCGGADKPTTANDPLTTYATALEDAREQYVADTEQGLASETTNAKQLHDRLKAGTGVLDEFIADLAAIKAPRAVAAEHAQLLAISTAYKQAVAENLKPLRSPDPADVKPAAHKLTRAADRFTTGLAQTLRSINAKLQREPAQSS